MRKLFLSVCSIFSLATVARSEATSLTLVNKSDGSVNCAFLSYLPHTNEATTFHWYTINNGQSRTFNHIPAQGLITNYRCESTKPGDHRVWGRNGLACVTRGSNYVNPFYEANNHNVCLSLNGEWKSFNRVVQTGHATHTLNP